MFVHFDHIINSSPVFQSWNSDLFELTLIWMVLARINYPCCSSLDTFYQLRLCVYFACFFIIYLLIPIFIFCWAGNWTRNGKVQISARECQNELNMFNACDRGRGTSRPSKPIDGPLASVDERSPGIEREIESVDHINRKCREIWSSVWNNVRLVERDRVQCWQKMPGH